MRRFSCIFYLMAILLLCTGCGEEGARTDQPRTYSQAGLSFEYPENWAVTKDETQEGLRYLFVESPGDAILIIQLYNAGNAMGIRDYAAAFAQSAKAETPVGTLVDLAPGRVVQSGGFEMLTAPFSISLLGEMVPHTRTFRRKRVADRTCFIVSQVADEDRPKVDAGFELIASTFQYQAP